MKNILTIIPLSFFILCSSLPEKPQTILWDENRPLTWDDFRGKSEPRFAGASTHYDIIKTLTNTNSNSATVNIEAIFFCKKSWKKKLWISESLLAHEQKHYDVVELFSRKLRKLLQENSYVSFSQLESKSDSLYKIIDKEMDVFQDDYDDGSNGSMDGNGQRAWNKKIMEGIHELDLFKNTAVLITYKK